MGFLKKLFGGGSSTGADFYTFNVSCNRCGETIAGRVNMSNDLSRDEEGGYHVRKVLIGGRRCFQQVEVILKFDASRKLLDAQVSGGKLVE
jgi:hypothetical protein